ncbi:MAG: LTA synthase family protein [Beijerinckiaceae bacterium]|nr:LTA synthase family protein [Beijerinckiaceae bacterium]
MKTISNWLAALRNALFPGPLSIALGVGLVFVAINLATRLAFAVMSGEYTPVRDVIQALLMGLVFDAGVAVFVMAPLCVLIALWPSGAVRSLRVTLLILALPLSALFVFTVFAEFAFWLEFTSRFNFIAVDYLVYSREVIGNIRESYNMKVLLSALGVLTLAVWWVIRSIVRNGAGAPLARSRRFATAAMWCVLPLAVYAGLDVRFKEVSKNAVINEVAGNGYFDILHAFWLNEIDYDRFYKTIDTDKARAIVARSLGVESSGPADHPFRRHIEGGPEKRMNVVLVTIESFSASFMGAFGSQKGLTPNMDQLATEGLLFTQLYATGTRTVRGLEAVTVAIPPTPGNSIVKRERNANLFTLGGVFREKGYDSLYLYGGYSYFDNMKAFYEGNGYTVIDRLAVSKADVHHENVWGISDEDVFALATREFDKRYAAGKPFFGHIMTTSNHRPYTYPANRIDLAPKKSGRDGGVKYTDWAIGDFVRKAREHAWFDNTLFVFVADHTHNGRGKTELPIENYHIPMVIYAPGRIAPAHVDAIASQIDIPPTILGLLGFSYESQFFGYDAMKVPAGKGRAFMSNYQTVGLYKNGAIVELRPKGVVRVVPAVANGRAPDKEAADALIDEAIAYYQVASRATHNGELREHKR